jgi:hypothetical protein
MNIKQSISLTVQSNTCSVSTRAVVLVAFEVLIAVVVNSIIFWDITPCSPLDVNRRFGGTYRLKLQVGRISRGSKLYKYETQRKNKEEEKGREKES